MIKTSQKASARFIFATIFLDALGIGFIIPTMPDLIRRFGTDPAFVNHYFGYFISLYAFMQFLASPILGSLADRFGRRPILLVSLLGAGLDYILMAFAPNLSILFVGRFISGLTGASMTVATAYMADISDDKNRAANFGMIGAAFGLGFIAGPVVGGFLGSFDPAAPFLGAAFLNILNFLFGIFVLPESLPLSLRRPFQLKKLNPFGSLYRVFRPSPLLLLIWVYLLLFLAGQVHPSVWTLYTQHKLNWSALEVGLSLSFVGVAIAFAQGFLTRIIIPKLGEDRSVQIGVAGQMIGFILFAFATQSWMMYAILAISCPAWIAGPALQTLISKNVPSQEQGELQGTLVSIASLTAIFGPLIYTWLFDHFIHHDQMLYFPGAPYAGAALICLISLSLLAIQKVRSSRAINAGIMSKKHS